MDQKKIGALIRTLRMARSMTQRQLAEYLCISDKAVSKWETGAGCPDISLLSRLSEIFGVELERLLSGELDANELIGGNMKKLQFYVCPDCGNLLTSTGTAAVSCCGRKLAPLTPQKTEEKLTVEKIENEWFVSSEHPMEKGHYIAFVALLNGDSVMLRKLYPEWNVQTRIPCIGHGALVWYCTRHGLFTQLI